MTALAEKVALANAIREQARRKLLPFILYTKSDYKAGWFHHKVCEKLDQFLDDVLAEKSPRLMLMAPPRHGKSEIISRRFPAFAFGRCPDLPMIATSYANDLASAMNRDVQRVIDSDEYHELFPSVTLSGAAVRTVTAKGAYLRNSDNFEIVNHKGGYKSAGVGTGVTGRGGRILLIDDPVKDAQEAYSQTTRDAVWNWYTSTLYTRCEPGGGILLIMTRWHEDDLAGRILKQAEKGGEQWEVVRFPAIAEEDEEYRLKGEPLHPERYSLKMLNNIRMGTGSDIGVGSRVWISLYQQRPSAAEGTIFRREHWKFFQTRNPMLRCSSEYGTSKYYKELLSLHQIIQVWDTAAGAKQNNDYSACVTLGINKTGYYVLEVWKDKLEFPELKRMVKLKHAQWKPSRVMIEGGGSIGGKIMVQELRRETRIPLFETTHATDKVLRANVVSPAHEAGKVFLPEDSEWAADFIDSCATFPNSANDDDVDAFIGALEEATQGRRPMKISDLLIQRVS